MTKINILFEDNHIIVIEKPVNIPTQEDSSGDIDLLTLIKEDLKKRYNKPGNVFVGLVHRLDRPVGGVMVFAKTSKAASRLSEQIRKGEFNKYYLAIIHGVLKEKKGSLENYLIKNKKDNIVSVVSEGYSEAKYAMLDYEVLQSSNNLSLVKINLHTGRSHQIRVQFSEINHPLFGDHKYNSKITKDEKQIALWSNKISFMHPISKELISFESFPTSCYPWNIFEIK